MQTITFHPQIQIPVFNKPMLAKLREVMDSAASFMAGPSTSERARVQIALNDVQAQQDRAIAAGWARFPVLGGF